jgi:Fe-S-cluster containining protein
MAVKVKVEKPQEEPNMCLGCIGHCCKLLVDLTTYDIFRIVAFTQKPAKDFAVLIEATIEDAFSFRLGDKLYKFVLDKHDDGFCVLLDKDKELKCTVDDVKPAICISYPFSLVDETVAFREDAVCPPGNRELVERLKMPLKPLRESVWERMRYIEIVDDWNVIAGDEDSLEDFIGFAAKEMELERSPLGSAYRKAKRFMLHRFRKR